MGLLRWLLWPRRSRRDDEEEEEPRHNRKRSRAHPSAYRIEVDGESRHMRGEGPPFSFWSSSRVILILAFLLWWIQPAGPMIAGYVGGRRAGSQGKAVIAALMPVIAIYLANLSYAHIFATQQVDFVASIPNALGGGAASILPFLSPYKDFMIAYLHSFVSALQVTFGMGTNGYLMVVLFAYIGGLIADQTRRELNYKSGAGQTVGLNLIQPIFGRPHAMADAYEEEDEELEYMRRPVRARAHRPSVVGSTRRRGHHVARFDDYRRIGAETEEDRGGRRTTRHHARDDSEDADEEDVEEPVRTRHPGRARPEEHLIRLHPASRAENEDDEEAEETERRHEPKEGRQPRKRSHEEEVAIQRFVERALRNYDHSKV